jgi:hypothetical protein
MAVIEGAGMRAAMIADPGIGMKIAMMVVCDTEMTIATTADRAAAIATVTRSKPPSRG